MSGHVLARPWTKAVREPTRRTWLLSGLDRKLHLDLAAALYQNMVQALLNPNPNPKLPDYMGL